MSYIDRIRKIEYQLIKNLPFTPTDEQKVAMTNSILKAQLTLAENDGEDITDVSQNPTTFLGASVTWDTSNPEGDGYTIELNGITVNQDADDPIGMIVNPNDGINDAEAVALDKQSLEIGLGSNPDLQSVESDLTFLTSGSNGTTITWDASGVSSIDNSGIVAQPSGVDESGQIVATISKGSESDTKTFNVTVLQATASGTEFITTWQTDAAGNTISGTDQVKLPLNSSGTYNFTVDWGDGTQDTITSYNQAETTHTYATVGSYDITIDGTCEGWGFPITSEDNSKLTGIKQWGNVKLHDYGYQFRFCSNLSSYTATDILDTSNLTNMRQMFYGCQMPTGFDVSDWDTSNVTDMTSIFRSATPPTGFDISGWDTSSVASMSYMFRDATLPDGFDISTWATSSVTDMSYMFYGTTLPSGFDISGWDTSSVTNMDQMFDNATLPDPFDLSGWNVALINTRPDYFGTFNGTTQLEPVWGTDGSGGGGGELLG